MKINSENNNSAVLSELGAHKAQPDRYAAFTAGFCGKGGYLHKDIVGGGKRRGHTAQQSDKDPPYTELS